MSTTLTLSQLRVEISERCGLAPASGVFTNVSNSTFADTTRTEADNNLNSLWIQDTTVSGGSVSRINAWTQSGGSATLLVPWSVAPVNGDAYEIVANGLSFPEMRRAINSGIALCGKALRTLVRDESQTLTSNVYQYSVTIDPSQANAFFPGQSGVQQISFLWWVGQPTREFWDFDWSFIDDSTIQFPATVVDSFAGDTIRFTGYGPITQRLKNDNPATVVATFPDEYMVDALVWACTSFAWKIVGSKKTAGESSFEMSMAQDALQMFQATLQNWRRGPTTHPSIISPVRGGWTS